MLYQRSGLKEFLQGTEIFCVMESLDKSNTLSSTSSSAKHHQPCLSLESEYPVISTEAFFEKVQMEGDLSQGKNGLQIMCQHKRRGGKARAE